MARPSLGQGEWQSMGKRTVGDGDTGEGDYRNKLERVPNARQVAWAFSCQIREPKVLNLEKDTTRKSL